MKFKFCPMENEVMAAVRSGQWPVACEPALWTHVMECKSCLEAASLCSAFMELRTRESKKARPSAPGLLFWKAQLQRRNQALEHITRPILAAEIVGFAATLFVLALVAWKWIVAPNGDLLYATHNIASMSLAGSWGWFLVAAVAFTLALFGGVALYLVTSKE